METWGGCEGEERRTNKPPMLRVEAGVYNKDPGLLSYILRRPFSSMVEETLSKFFKTNSEPPPSKESVTKLDELELLLHGLDLGYLADIMTENDITWSYLLTMEKEDLEKIDITDPEHQQKVLSAVQQMHLDKVDLDTVNQLGAADSGSEELHNFLISVRQQCCYLTEIIQDVINRFPRQASQLVFSLDSKKEAQVICNQLVVQAKNLQTEVTCLRNLLCQPRRGNGGTRHALTSNELFDSHPCFPAGDCCQLPPPVPRQPEVAAIPVELRLSTSRATFLSPPVQSAHGKVDLLQMYRNVQ
ncbi:ankyrin repeat, SAM and basic leucine zipper domain-containing protein 1 [Lates japonicus]|uniref:Ankyrin repeat, SAM and basic leucine zipper domain-containing protein 1 n=1 Tax=Lates japonicus TaxID=270547 RepID=A0AAD3RIM4_LATJO|nr:ankyrin repeat, SAM and basic leucine zipper domain-containing protein 1 [Lates japonicus]